ncbi:MAG: hypothetical protein ABW352_13490, partial [Polyangiales bacterium]
MQRTALIMLVLAGCAKELSKPPPQASQSPLQAACPGPVPEPKPGVMCTEKGCENGYVVVLQPKAPWPEGQYRFQFDIDGSAVTCTGSLPLRSCTHRNAMCDNPDVTLAESGCDLPAASHSFWSIAFSGFPREVKTKVTHNGAPIADTTLKP